MRSANEISAMVLKAARGAGLPLGCAEELARAAPVLASTGDLICVTGVLELACETVPRIGIATIYRNLKTMVDEGLLRQVVLPGENPRFELSGHGHHHHFQCKQCQKVFDIHSCPTDLAALAPKGFTIEDHDLTLYGRCKNC